MNIKKMTLTAIAFFAAVTTCLAAKKLTTSSEGESTGPANESSGSPSTASMTKGDTLTFSLDDGSLDEIDGYEVLTEFLPSSVELEWTGNKLKAPKSGKVKYSKKEGGFVDTKDSENPSRLSVSYNKNSGKVSGSFKVYVAKSEKKLKTYSARFSGTVGGDISVSVKGHQMSATID